MYFVLILSVFIVGSETAKAEEVKSNVNNLKLSSQDIQNLKDLGFTEDEIMQMDKEEYEMNKNLDGEVVGENTNYIKITEPEETAGLSRSSKDPLPIIEELDEETYNKEVAKAKKQDDSKVSTRAASHSTKTKYKKMTTNIIKLGTNKYRLKNSVTWSRVPGYRYVDVNGIGINGSFWGPLAGSQYGKQNWKTWSTCNGYKYDDAVYTKKSTKWKSGEKGYSLKINLPNDVNNNGCASDGVEALSSYMYYTVVNQTKTNKIDAWGQYAHQEANYTLSPSISLSGVDFSVSPSKKFSIHPNTFAQVFK